ncbi:hypothetical protein OESDEN_00276 [Oesophagostomum dentatum]|uniref:Uncharacterized protein n=1 Tax=Oesophagostomum dentatum TaxID=61180 RepID=A0A0B1TWA3_OESDE|nr:hypothetical protein OESDEN_00276 [Oesophagostomum dentatum]
MDRSIDFSDYAINRRLSAPRSRMGVSAVHECTPRSTRIPVPMSRSLSASCERTPTLRRNTFSSPVAIGSGEQLCDEGNDSKGEIRRLLERSRTRQPIRVAGYEARCLLPSTSQMSASLPPLSRSKSRPRLLQRPQMPRRGEQVAVGGRLSASRSQSRSRSAYELAAAEVQSTSSAKHPKRWRRQRNRLGGFSLDIRRLVSVYRSPLSTCHICRSANALRRLVTKRSPRFVPCGIAKPDVVRKSMCICRRDKVQLSATFKSPSLIEPAAAQKIIYLLDWASLFALVSLSLSVVLRLLAL